MARVLATATLAAVGGLSLWALAPTALGWQAHVVVSGSMAPAIAVGDIVLVAPADAGQLVPGRVALFRDPVDPGRTIAHRIVSVAEGLLVTRGDANRVDDSSPVPVELVEGLGRLRVPYLGLPSVWLGDGRLAPLAATIAGAVAAVWLAAGTDEPGPHGRRRAPRTSARPGSGRQAQQAGTSAVTQVDRQLPATLRR